MRLCDPIPGPPRGAVKKTVVLLLFALCLALSGCGDRLLERSYSSVVPHSAAFWENEDADTLRAENYQDLVNALLLLLGEHSEDGVVRIYGDAPNKARLAENACVEVQKETPIGAYLLDYITYDGKAESGYYELTVRFGYRRTAEEQAAIVNATSTEALPDLLRTAVSEKANAVAVRIGWFGTDRAGVLALVAAVHDEVYPPEPEPEPEPAGDAAESAPADGTEPAGEGETPAEPETPGAAEPPQEPSGEGEPPAEGEAPGEGETPEEGVPPEPAEPAFDLAPWQVLFYPDTDQPGIIEVILNES